MTGPLNVDPNDVDSVAVQWDALREQFNRPAPNLTGSGPESQAARARIAEAAASTAKLQSDIGDTASTAHAGASAYTQQEGASAGTMKPGDVTGVMGDVIGAGTSLIGEGPQFFGALTGLVGSSAGVLGSLTGAATSLSRQQGQQQNSNNTNPQDSHDQVPPEMGEQHDI
jgi:hypothetical protein